MGADDNTLEDFEYHFKDKMQGKIKELIIESSPKKADEGSKTASQPAGKAAPDLCKRLRELTDSPEGSATNKPEKRPRASTKEEWVEVLVTKNLRKSKRKTKRVDKTPERPRRACPEAVLINSAEGVSYAAIYAIPRNASNLKKWASQFRASGRRTPRTYWKN